MEETQMTPLESRQAEIAQYQANIATFTSIASSLPSEWPDHLIQYKGAKNKHEVISSIESLEDVELLSDLWTHDDAKSAIRTETLEMRKAIAILSTLS